LNIKSTTKKLPLNLTLDLGGEVHTVNDKESALLLESYGVDEIFSNYPDIIQKNK